MTEEQVVFITPLPLPSPFPPLPPSSFEEECSAPLCTSALTAKNRELQCDVKCVTTQFDKLSRYINMLALPSQYSLPSCQPSDHCNAPHTFSCTHAFTFSISYVLFSLRHSRHVTILPSFSPQPLC